MQLLQRRRGISITRGVRFNLRIMEKSRSIQLKEIKIYSGSDQKKERVIMIVRVFKREKEAEDVVEEEEVRWWCGGNG